MTAALIPVVVALIAALGGFWVAQRQFSGQIKTSEASDLWNESSSIRKWSSERINALESRVESLEHKNDGLLEESRELRRQNTSLMEEKQDLIVEREDLKDQVSTLTRKLDKCEARIADLEKGKN